ncbi:hypothetical protein K9N68_04335 [Kovacikia minuta CCNUW1]|uniref:hypothetical protein n=1 Tax=Kovacikia minuta TaxID=2931930 RepID=UPI001CCE52F6|nr:hypothetical protein [Kovacikia minuta]UBF27200.1 hypothetical protein K9N68_04335 [Kovacikia minuta CCNUW1]
MNPKLLLSLFLGVNSSFFLPAVSLAATTGMDTRSSVRPSSVEVEVVNLNRSSSQPFLTAGRNNDDSRRNNDDSRRNNDDARRRYQVNPRWRQQVNPWWRPEVNPRWRNNADAGRRNNFDARRRDYDDARVRNRRIILISPWR